MLYALEALVGIYLVYAVWRVFRRGTVRNLLGLAGVLAAAAVSTAGFLAAVWITSRCGANLIVQLSAPLTVAAVAYLVVQGVCIWAFRSNTAPAVIATKRRLALPAWLDRLLCGVYAVGLLGLVALVALFLVSLASVVPEWRQALAEHSVVLKRFLPEEPAADLASPPSGGADTADEPPAPERALGRLGRAWVGLREGVAERTGIKVTVEYLEAFKEIANLRPEEYRWLVETNAPLKALVNNPALLAVLQNQRVLDLITRLGAGSVGALYELGDEPQLKALFDDPDMRAAVRALDLLELQRQVHEYRRRGGRVPLCWALNRIENTLELDGKLRDLRDWKGPVLAPRLEWTPGARIGLALTEFRVNDANQEQLELQFRTAAQLTVLVNDRSVHLEARDGWQVLPLPCPPGLTRVVVLADFADVDGGRECLVQAFRVRPGT